ncbi:MAG: hypothetical protein GXZ18_00810 [Synergistaceae bacterium]|nr:hypothetical protein [Synergistaceae bacterium]
MLNRIKVIAFSIFFIVTISAGTYFLFNMPLSSHLKAAVPAPSEIRPYVLIDTQDYTYPTAFSTFLTDGEHSMLKEGTPRSLLLAIAATAKDAVVLVEEQGENRSEVYTSLRFRKDEMTSLQKGILPESLKNVIKTAKVSSGETKNIWLIQTESVATPIYYKVNNKQVIMAADLEALNLMNDLSRGQVNSLAKKKWIEEASWPSHIEICDGGLFSSIQKKTGSLKIEAAWQTLKHDKNSDPTGELKWRISGLNKDIAKFIKNSITPTKWDTSECLIPEPLLFTMGVNMSYLKGTFKRWPFPLRNLAELGKSMGLTDKDIRELLSGKVIASIGGHNRILWFNLPGFMIELSAEKPLLKKLISAYWEKLFFGTEPNPVSGFEFGGTASLPFSALGVANDKRALVGLISPESIKISKMLSRFMKGDKEVLGWVAADLPLIGEALKEMAKINFLVDDQASEESPFYDENTTAANGEKETVTQPEMDFSSFDNGTTDSFSNLLKNLGKILIVWEKDDSGRLNWFDTATAETEKK